MTELSVLDLWEKASVYAIAPAALLLFAFGAWRWGWDDPPLGDLIVWFGCVVLLYTLVTWIIWRWLRWRRDR